jgi:hypothetical protein
VGMSTARIFWGLNFTMWGFIHVIDVYIYIIIWLVVSTPLKNMKVSWDYIPNIWKKKFQTSNQLYIPFGWISSVYTISCICLYTGSPKKNTKKRTTGRFPSSGGWTNGKINHKPNHKAGIEASKITVCKMIFLLKMRHHLQQTMTIPNKHQQTR